MYGRERWILREWWRKEEMLDLVKPSEVIVCIIYNKNMKSQEFVKRN